MKHTDAQIEEAARRFEQLADNLDPASVAAEDLSDLRAVAEAAEQVRRDEALVTERVPLGGPPPVCQQSRIARPRYSERQPILPQATTHLQIRRQRRANRLAERGMRALIA
jgi:hypothetical protein